MAVTIELRFAEQWASPDAFQKAAYRHSLAFSIELQRCEAGWICSLTASNGVSEYAFQRAVDEFKKDLVDEALRARLKTETEPVRNLILSAAFSRTGLQSGS